MPHRASGSGTVRRRGPLEWVWPAGGSVSLGAGFEVSDAQARPSVAFRAAAC